MFNFVHRVSALTFLLCASLAAQESPSHQDSASAPPAKTDEKNDQVWFELARQGDIASQFKVATLYDEGTLTSENPEAKAFYWYEKAAKQGHTLAAYNLGNAYKHGRGAVQSESLANYWWQKAADTGLASAQFNLALQYSRGLGVDQDQQRAIRLINTAARSGHAKAESLLESGRVPRVDLISMDDPSKSGVLLETKLSADTEMEAPKESNASGASGKSVKEDVTEKEVVQKKETWIASQPENYFTIQLAVMAKEDNIIPFLQEHNLADRAQVVPMELAGQHVSYIILGSFETKAACQTAIENLPPITRQLAPWPRPLADLQGRSSL